MADPGYPGGMKVEFWEREQETDQAMAILGCSWEQWTFSDAEPDWLEIEVQMRVLDEGPLDPRYERVFAPAFALDGNAQHNMIAQLADRVFGDRVTYYTTYTSNGRAISDREVEYEPEWIALKHRALACYSSQSAHPATRQHFMADLREYVL